MIQHQFRNDERLQGLEQRSAGHPRLLERGLCADRSNQTSRVHRPSVRSKYHAARVEGILKVCRLKKDQPCLSTPCVADHTLYGRNQVTPCSSATALVPPLFSDVRTPLRLLDHARDGQYPRLIGVMLRVLWSTSCIPDSTMSSALNTPARSPSARIRGLQSRKGLDSTAEGASAMWTRCANDMRRAPCSTRRSAPIRPRVARTPL